MLELVIRRICETHADLLLAVHFDQVRFLARHLKELSNYTQLCSVPRPETLDLVHDKWTLHQFLCDHGLPSPVTKLIRNTPEFWQEAAGQQFPAAVKLLSGSSGMDMMVYESFEQMAGSKEQIERLAERAVLQSYIIGYDIDFNMLCKEGEILAYTIQKSAMTRRNPFGADRAIEFFDDEETLDTVRRLVKLLRWNGVANLDIRVSRQAGERMVVDFNPRYWASMCGSLIAGVNFPVIACYEALGLPLPPHQQKLTKYIWPVETIYQLPRQLFVSRGPRFSFAESGLQYVFKDPKVYSSLFLNRLRSWKFLKSTLLR